MSEQVDDSSLRQTWKVNSAVQIYSNSRKKWYTGEVAQIFHDSEGEWLEVRYDKSMSKQVQRYSTDIKPTNEQIEKLRDNSRRSKDVPFPEEEMNLRASWTKNFEVEIFSNTHQEWYVGKIIDVIKDEEGEWLNVVWHRDNGEAMSKQVQRFSTDVRPVQGESEANEGYSSNNKPLTEEEEIRQRRNGFVRRAPPFSRTLKPSTWTFPATSQFRRGKKLGDVDEGDDEGLLGVPKINEVRKWSGVKVSEYIGSMGKAYEKYKSRFRSIKGSDLLMIDDIKLSKLAIPRINRLKILTQVELIRRNDPTLVESQAIDVLNWDVLNVKRWLMKKPICNQYARQFESHGVDGLLLFNLDSDDLYIIGVKNEKHKDKILECIRQLSRETFNENTPNPPLSNEQKDEESLSLSNSNSISKKKQKRRGSIQMTEQMLNNLNDAPLDNAMHGGVLLVLDDMASLLHKLTSIFSMAELQEDAFKIQQTISILKRKYESSSPVANIQSLEASLYHNLTSDLNNGLINNNNNNNSDSQNSSNSNSPNNSASPKASIITRKTQDSLEDNSVSFAKQWINTLQNKSGHRRRQSLTINESQLPTQILNEEEEEEDEFN